jgi:hypothetical protein
MNKSLNRYMSKVFRTLSLALALCAVLFGSAAVRAQQTKKNSKGESFYIVASVDRTRSQVLLKLPTEVTIMMKVDAKTQFNDATGKAMKLPDLRSGDTVWVASTGGDQPTATRIEEGAMTVAELHQMYLDYGVIK